MVAKKSIPDLPDDALVPTRPESKVEAGLKGTDAAKSDDAKPGPTEQGQAMLEQDAAAMEQLISERAAVLATETLVKLGVPEDVARLAVAGDLDAAAAAADGVNVGKSGDICPDGCFISGWDGVPGFDSVSCVHGSWKR